MRVFKRKNLVGDDMTYEEFAAFLGECVTGRDRDPILLSRDDGARVLISVRSSRMMLAVAFARNRFKVSAGYDEASGAREFRGLRRSCTTRDEYFIDPRSAMQAVRAFFEKRPIARYVDFLVNLPDSELLEFPHPYPPASNLQVDRPSQTVKVPQELADDLREVCQFLSYAVNDPDEDLDFDDAIQFGGLCGGRVDRKKDIYTFTYYHEDGHVWEFSETGDGLDGIARGAFATITVTVISGA